MSSITTTGNQYRDSSKLTRRANIHKYGTPGGVGWFDWIAEKAALPDRARVLDVGCGPGWMWGAAGFPAGLDITLTDISDGMVAEALPRVRGFARYAAVEGRQADVAALPFPDASFDAVLACHMLYHVPDPGRALDEMVRVLRPGGVLAITTNGIEAMAEMHAVANAAWGGPRLDPGGSGFGLERARDELGTRLKSVALFSRGDVLRVTDGEDVLGVLTSYPPGDGATDAQLATAHGLIAERMAAEAGVFAITIRQGLVRGVKG